MLRLNLLSASNMLSGKIYRRTTYKGIFYTAVKFFMLIAFVMGSSSVYGKKLQSSFQTPDTQGTWNSEKNVYSWTLGYSNLMTIFKFNEGELANYAALHLTTSSYTSEYRICFMKEENIIATITFYSDGQKDLIFSERSETKEIDLSQITSIRFGGASDSGSIGINPSNVYLSGHTVTFGPYNGTNGTVTATVNDTPINSGDIVADKTIVTFTAKGNDDNLPWKWYIGSQVKYSQDPETVTITEDINVTHEFGSVYVNAYTNDANLGTVNIRHGSNNATSFHVTPWAGEFTIEAIPTGHNTFDGWYEEAEHTNKYEDKGASFTISNPSGTNNYFAKFTYVPIYVNSDFANRGTGDVTWEGGVLTTSAYYNNWANIFVHDDGTPDHKNVDKTFNNFSGFSITAKGHDFRVIVYVGDTPYIKVLPCNEIKATSYRFYWLDFDGLTNIEGITRICVAGSQENTTRTTTFTGATLFCENTGITDLDFSQAGAHSKSDGDVSWAVTVDGKAATLETSSTSNNMKFIYDFTDGGNMEGHNALEFTGIRLNAIGNRYRVIAYVNGGATNTDRYVGFITNTGEDTKFEDPNKTMNKTQHFKWSDLKVQWGAEAMTDDKVSQITHIAIAGDDAAAPGKVVLSNVWLETINDYDHTFVCYGEEGGSYNGTNSTYSYSQNGSTVTFTKIDGNSRDENNCIKVKDSSQTQFKAPANTNFNTIKVIYQNGTSDSYSPNANTFDIDNSAVKVIAKIEYSLDKTSISESHTITSSSESRDYWIYVPVSIVTAESGTYPVLFSLHGTSNDYEPTNGGVQNYNDLAEQNKFIVIYPRGKMRKFPGFDGGVNDLRGWDSDGTGKNTAEHTNKDIQFFRDIVNDLTTNNDLFGTGNNLKDRINTSKIYITGYSNGGMMTYAAANAAPDLFAAFASISGLPMNEFHLQTNGVRPVPFLHIHGTKDDFVKYTHMPKIVDNMVYRNGCNPVPTVNNGDATVYGTATRYKKSTYTSSNDTPYIYIEIGTGIGTSDTGMGHNKECVIGGVDSKQVIWNFLKTYTKPNTHSTLEFGATPETANFNPAEHGWTKSSSNIILQYGETKSSNSNNQYVYHSLQLKGGNHNLTFTANNSVATKWVTAKLEKLATIRYINDHDVVEPITEEKIFEKHYILGSSKDIKLNFTTSGDGEYRLSFLAGSNTIERDENGEIIPNNTTISNIQINSGSVGSPTDVYTPSANTDFTGYFNYHNRLVAQWNFDLCDYHFFVHSALSSTKWDADYSGASKDHRYGTIVYTYKSALSDNQLTYDGSTLIPISAGLKFYADANKVKFIVHVSNGEVTSTQLQLESGVKLYIPYIENTYRSYNGEDGSPKENNREAAYKATSHHIKRDILYVASTSDIWTKMTNTYDTDKKMFNSGGTELVDGLTFYKLNYTGQQGQGNCFIEIKDGETAVFNRIGVNRNLTYSFFTENLAATTGYTRPYPGLRIIGSPQGAAIADIGATYKTYSNAIAMTYGGWKWNGGKYSVQNANRTDDWGELIIHNREKTEAQMQSTLNNTPVPIDGFPVFSIEGSPASSEGGSNSGSMYHPINTGEFDDSSEYTANHTPWTLPCRGAYVKFEPTLPGVLNVHMYQEGNKKYIIADEFGKTVANISYKTGMGQTGTCNGTLNITNTDYVRYSFDVKPGKSYYIFSSTATKTGFSGFYFEPLVKIATGSTTREDVVIGNYTLPAEGYNGLPSTTLSNAYVYYDDSYTALNSVATSTDAVEVEIGRAFDANKWTSICLPFSMNNLEMETLFGKDTRVVLLRDIQERGKNGYDKTTINFIAHENQDIIAGYPYFIYPTKSVAATDKVIVSLLSNDDYNDFIKNHPVTINSVGPKTMVKVGDYGGLEGYTFMGSQNGNVAVKAGSYALANSTGALTRISADMNMKPYRAFLSFTGTPEQILAKKLEATRFLKFIDEESEQGTTTVIEDLLLEQGIVTTRTNVYNLNGQIVRANTLNLDGLPKGTYIINGKKYVVR